MRNIELAYLFTACAMIWIMVRSTRGEKFPTFSHISTGTKVARQAFSGGLFIAGLLFALLMYKWFIPHFSLGNGFRILAAVIAFSHILTGFSPVEAKHLGRLHILFGSVLAVAMFVLLLAFTFTTTVPNSVRTVNGTIAASMIIFALSTLWARKDPKQLLLHEYIFFGLWHAAIFITAYIA